ncbi:hypothetical protein [Mycobacterium spongiae]|uniref:Uncharacterized protein n=1 Tax=Mycobacterium spongiae TaxID=886343 RepID=A0A975PXV7_9MYCO|nr:hypothetical protein [Mycobacterium spongiae]QUR68666.1 hypothetical protein F6B93_17675 [Mycobacterium spongiae]
MGMLVGLAPWIVYWVLIGNVQATLAVVVALAIAVAVLAIGRTAGHSEHWLEVGSVATFLVLAVVTFAVGESVVQQWLLSLSIAGILLVALVGQLVGRPFVRQFAAAEHPPDVVKTELFDRITKLVSWAWIAVFAGMTVSAAIPPLAQQLFGHHVTGRDATTPLSFVCSWVIPFSLFGAVIVVSRVLLDRMLAGADDIVRSTSFVAYDEATIDELYYLAQEHADREVGPGKEAYNVKVGGMGTPLTGDASRKSWPSTYKVRDRRR